jgi:hypothetical protein
VEDFVISDAGSLSKYTGNGGYVVIPEGVKEIAGGFSEVAYLGEAPLTGIEMPSTLTRITGLFTNQTSLTGELVIPESCSYVSSALFAGTGITKVTMLRQTNIGGNGGTLGDSGGLTTPFSKMPELKEIYIGGVFF